MEKLRIAIVSNANSIHVSRWANWLEKEGHTIQIFSLKKTSKSVFFGPEPPLNRTLLLNFGNKIRKTARKLQILVDKFKPDLVHGYFLTNHGFYASKIKNYPIIVQVMGSDLLLHAEESWLLSHVVKSSIKNADCVVAPPLLIEKLEKLGIEKRKIYSHIIGINTDIFKPLKKENAVLFSRGFKEVYNPNIVAEAILKITQKNAKIKFYLAGDGPLKKDIELKLTNANVHFTGQLSEAELSKLMGLCKVVISPSFSDSIPLTVFESMACGSIIIASDIPAHRQWENTGYPISYFEVNDSETLSDYILELCNDKNSINDALEMGPKLVKENWNWEDQANAMLRQYKRNIIDLEMN